MSVQMRPRMVGPDAQPEVPALPRLEVVPPKTRSRLAQRRRARLLALLAAVAVCVGLFGLVAFHVLLTEGQLQLDRLQRQAADAQDRYERLRLQVAELEAPERVVAVAQQRLGMLPAPGVTYLSPSGVRAVAPEGGSQAMTPKGETAGDRSGDHDDNPATAGGWPAVKRQLARGS